MNLVHAAVAKNINTAAGVNKKSSLRGVYDEACTNASEIASP